MTPPTDELTRMLQGAADDVLERGSVDAPDTPRLWSRGRRGTWAARAGAAALVAAAVALVTTVALVMRPAQAALPAEGAPVSYPEFVSELFVGAYRDGTVPVFGVVDVPAWGEGPPDRYVIDRAGLLAQVRGTNLLSTGGALAPDGRHLFTGEGVGDLADGTVVRPISTDATVLARTDTRVAWSPDSRHVLVDTTGGPAVLDTRTDVVLRPGPGDATVRAAGWRDTSTVLGLREVSVDGRTVLEVVTRPLAGGGWTVVSVVGGGDPGGGIAAVHASPDGTRILLLRTPSGGSGARAATLVDVRSGERIALGGSAANTPVDWDSCPPVWRGDQPLLALGGLREPGSRTAVLAFSGRLDVQCVSLAGDELTGTADPLSAGVERERVWRVALPAAGGLALVAVVWMLVALRRSRREGERFLPMIWVQRY
ncbi:hypothetical protein [Oryzobacter telluris]|uniref:hypothetical protein n=1 Tax=Oryzobacter telluris TaxID=3149179 RepID=UPI00370DD79B